MEVPVPVPGHGVVLVLAQRQKDAVNERIRAYLRFHLFPEVEVTEVVAAADDNVNRIKVVELMSEWEAEQAKLRLEAEDAVDLDNRPVQSVPGQEKGLQKLRSDNILVSRIINKPFTEAMGSQNDYRLANASAVHGEIKRVLSTAKAANMADPNAFFISTVAGKPGRLVAGLLGEGLDNCPALSEKAVFESHFKSVSAAASISDFSCQDFNGRVESVRRILVDFNRVLSFICNYPSEHFDVTEELRQKLQEGQEGSTCRADYVLHSINTAWRNALYFFLGQRKTQVLGMGGPFAAAPQIVDLSIATGAFPDRLKSALAGDTLFFPIELCFRGF